MDDLQIKRLQDDLVIMGEGLQRAEEALRAAAVAFGAAATAKAIGIEPEAETWGDARNPVEDLRRHLEEMYAKYAMGEFVDIAEEPSDIPPPRKIPRPPKYLGPVNKANYAANRPPRIARSSCRIIRHR